MSFIVPMTVLIAALVAGAFIAPRTVPDVTSSRETCVLESGGWGVINPDCAEMGHGARSRGEATGMWAGETRHHMIAYTDRPIF